MVRAVAWLVASFLPLMVAAQTYPSDEHTFRVVKVVEGLDHPWSIAFLIMSLSRIPIVERYFPDQELRTQGPLQNARDMGIGDIGLDLHPDQPGGAADQRERGHQSATGELAEHARYQFGIIGAMNPVPRDGTFKLPHNSAIAGDRPRAIVARARRSAAMLTARPLSAASAQTW